MSEDEDEIINSKKYDESLKVILLGEVFTGKTSLINVFIKKKFKEDVQSTITPSYLNKIVKIGKKSYLLNIWDTAGQEQYRSMNKIFITSSDIVIFTYDITRKKTLVELSFWLNSVEECLGKDAAIYAVLGNKLDLFDKIKELKAKDTKNEIELVTSDDGKEFADNIGAFFLETSAKESAPGFEELIHKLVEQYNKKRNPTKKKKKFSLKNDESTSDTEHKSKCCGD